jgi:hypothetical protein
MACRKQIAVGGTADCHPLSRQIHFIGSGKISACCPRREVWDLGLGIPGKNDIRLTQSGFPISCKKILDLGVGRMSGFSGRFAGRGASAQNRDYERKSPQQRGRSKVHGFLGLTVN